MADEHDRMFSDSAPLRQNKGVERHLDNSCDDRWLFRLNKSLFLAPFIITLSLVILGSNGIWVALIALAFLLLVFFGIMKDAVNTPVFDFSGRYYYRDWRKPRYGDPANLKEYLPFSEISALQFLYKPVTGSKGRIFQAYELNIITQDLTRVFITDSKNKKKLFAEAQLLAEKLDVPLKENTDNKVRTKKTPLWLCIFVLVMFGTFGVMFFLNMVIFPLRQNLQAMSWKETPAVIVESCLQSERRRGKHGSYTVYKANIRYKYRFKGREYISGRGNFFNDGSSRFESGKRRLVRNNPPGKKITCFVDPQKPSRAIISRKIPHGSLWLNSGLSAVILLAGAATFLVMRKKSEE